MGNKTRSCFERSPVSPKSETLQLMASQDLAGSGLRLEGVGRGWSSTSLVLAFNRGFYASLCLWWHLRLRRHLLLQENTICIMRRPLCRVNQKISGELPAVLLCQRLSDCARSEVTKIGWPRARGAHVFTACGEAPGHPGPCAFHQVVDSVKPICIGGSSQRYLGQVISITM